MGCLCHSQQGVCGDPWLQPCEAALQPRRLPKFMAVLPSASLDFGAGPRGTELLGTLMLFAYKDFCYICVCM